MSPWVFDPQSGGTPIPEAMQEEIQKKILVHTKKLYPKSKAELVFRFRKQFCYVDSFEPGSNQAMPLCRLRYFGGRKEWSLAFYTYSNEKYEPCLLSSGKWCGSVEETFETGSSYLAC
jgi:hypothetical protein